MSREKNDAPETLAEIFFYISNDFKRKDLEQYRIKYEKIHGPTDLTKLYTSRLSIKERNWLLKNYPRRYFDGLPPFCKAYIKDNLTELANSGALDNANEKMIELFLTGQIDESLDYK